MRARLADPTPRLERAALFYAGLGWRVLACEPGGKKPMLGGWQRRATTDPDRIRAWWTRTPTANVGIVCDNVAVIDIEAPAVEPLSAWMAERGYTLPAGPLAWTGRGGFHAYCLPDDRRKADLKLGEVRLGELRTGMHQVVAPPSRTVDDYRWVVLPSEPLPAVPAWIDELLPANSGASVTAPVISVDFTAGAGIRKLDALARRVADSTEGERNAILFWAARKAAAEEHPLDVASRVLLRAAIGAGLHDREAEATIRSGFAWGAR